MNCKNCGNPINEGDMFCGACGAKIEPENIIDDSQEATPSNSQKDSLQQDSTGFDPYALPPEDSAEMQGAVKAQADNSEYYQPYEAENNAVHGSSQSNGQNAQNVAPAAVSANSNAGANVKTVRINKKALIITISVVAAVAVAAVLAFVIWNHAPINLDLNDYISDQVYTDEALDAYYDAHSSDYDYDLDDDYDEFDENSTDKSNFTNFDYGIGLTVSGYNEYASISEYDYRNIIDWSRLIDDVNAQLAKKKKVNGRHLDFYDYVNNSSFAITADKTEDIKNDDEINFEIQGLNMKISGITLRISDASKTYKISGLKVVNAFDPFDYVDMVLYNPANGFANAKCVVSSDLNEPIQGVEGLNVAYYDDSTVSVIKDNSIVAKIFYYFSDDDEDRDDLQNGEKLTMYCYTTGADITEKYSLYIARSSTEFEVSGLGEYASKATSFNSEQLERFKSNASDYLNAKFADYSGYGDAKFVGAYIADLKDKSSNSSFHNDLRLVYSYSYSYWDDESETKYAYVCYEDIIVDSDGTVPFTPDIYFDDYGTGYSSIDDALKRYDAENFNVTKLS